MAEEEVKLTPFQYCYYYVVLFFAFWFGASRFDVDGDGDFDPADVKAYFSGKVDVHSNYKRPAQPPKKKKKKKNIVEGVLEQDVEGEAEEERVVRNLKEGQVWPLFIIFEILVCGGLWFIMAVKEGGDTSLFQRKAGLDSFEPQMTDLRLYNNNCEDYRFQAWRWLTYQFTHVGATHVMMNVFLCFVLGLPLEGMHGAFRMLLMFNIGVFGGAACFFFNEPHTAVVGCSGGCYALIGIHLADLLMNWNAKKFRWMTFLFLAGLIGIDLFSYFMTLSAANASHTAHAGGGVTGLLIGVLLVRNMETSTCDRILQGMTFFVGAVLVVFSLAWLIDHPAPVSIWATFRGESGYCWIRQIYDPAINPTSFVCVRCGTQECIDSFAPWNPQDVSRSVCYDLGFANI